MSGRFPENISQDATIVANAYGRGTFMLQISAQQLADLLIGIGRAQAALIGGIESAMAGTKNTHIVPMLQNAAHLRDHPNPTLVDLPVRVLLTSLGRIGPDPAALAKDLERLFSAQAAPAAGADEALDFSKK